MLRIAEFQALLSALRVVNFYLLVALSLVELLPTDLQSRSLYLLPVIVLCEPAVNPCEVALHRIYFLSVF